MHKCFNVDLLIKSNDNSAVEFAYHMGNQTVLRLYNSNCIRPTVYSVESKLDQFGEVCGWTLDTIVRENKEHECLKVTFQKKEAQHMENTLHRLMLQDATGSKEITLTHFDQLGMLYLSKEA